MNILWYWQHSSGIMWICSATHCILNLILQNRDDTLHRNKSSSSTSNNKQTGQLCSAPSEGFGHDQTTVGKVWLFGNVRVGLATCVKCHPVWMLWTSWPTITNDAFFMYRNNYSVSQKKVAPLKLFVVFSLGLSIFPWNFASMLSVYIYTYLLILVDLSYYLTKWR